MPVMLTLRPAPDEMLTMRPHRCGLHGGGDRPGAEERRGEVGVDDGAPILDGDLLERVMHLAAHAAGVVDEDVDHPDRGEPGGDGARVGQIGGVPVDAVDGGAVGPESLRDGGADAVGRPGHDGRAAGEPAATRRSHGRAARR